MSRPKSQHSTCKMSLLTDAETGASLEATFSACAAMLDWLDETVPADRSSDLIALNRQFYEPARAMFGLPAQMTILLMRDWTRRRRGEQIEGIALDDKLFSVRSTSQISVATIAGRQVLPYRIIGYFSGWNDNATARLVRVASGYEIRVASEVRVQQEEIPMAVENIVGRIGRLIAGMAHHAIDQAEQANAEAVLEQAMREIDAAAEEVRVDLGKATAERYRVESRRKELGGEIADLDRSIKVAIGNGRDDLAKAGIERQIDIEAQLTVLDSLLKDIDDSMSQYNTTLDAVRASRREAESRLADLRKSTAIAASAGERSGSATGERVDKAKAAIQRVTGVAGGPGAASPDIADLKQLAREQAIRERLDKLKSGQ